VQLPGVEDKEWALHWLDRGYECLIDPGLAVAHDHADDRLPAIYRRARREAEGYAAFVDRGPGTAAALARDWWSDRRFYDSAARARLTPRRAAPLGCSAITRGAGARHERPPTPVDRSSAGRDRSRGRSAFWGRGPTLG